ncbi:MAG: RluA family pseudouridine synthase [bacterium]|nr:RluA family pseudouridine synthase [bacterium]
MGRFSFTVTTQSSKIRLDRYLAERLPDLTRSRIKKLIENNHVLVDGSPVKAGFFLRDGSQVTVAVPAPETPDVLPEEIPLTILYEDADLIVIDKPPHMVVHPSHGHRSGTLVNALLHHCRDLSGIGGVARPGIVHRLDKGTSGVMVAAKNDAAHNGLAVQFKDHTIGRTYLAAVKGEMKKDTGRIERSLDRHPRDRKRIAVRKDGRPAVTDFEVMGRRGGISLVRLTPGTGRTHQLRVHLSAEGHPILGDPTYRGGTSAIYLGNNAGTTFLRSLRRPALHALRLEFDHPATGKRMEFEAPPPGDLSGLFDWIMGRI